MRNQHEAFIQYAVKRWTSSSTYLENIGKYGVLKGCTDKEIETIRVVHKIDELPHIYVEFMKAMGRNTGGLWIDGQSTYPKILDNYIDWQGRFLTLIYNTTHDFLHLMTLDASDPLIYYASIQKQFEIDDKPISTLSEWLIDAIEAGIAGQIIL